MLFSSEGKFGQMSIPVFGFDGSPTPTRPLAFIGFPLVAVDEGRP